MSLSQFYRYENSFCLRVKYNAKDHTAALETELRLEHRILAWLDFFLSINDVPLQWRLLIL